MEHIISKRCYQKPKPLPNPYDIAIAKLKRQAVLDNQIEAVLDATIKLLTVFTTLNFILYYLNT